jgi:hypothetical protein
MKCRQNIALVSVLLLPLLLTACGPSAERRLIGTWKADTSQIVEQAQAEGNPMAGMYGKMAEVGSFTVQFKKDGKMSHRLKVGVISIDGDGQWKVLDESGDEATIERRYSKANSGEEVVDQTAVRFEGKDRIRMEPPGNWAGVWFFDRVKED